MTEPLGDHKDFTDAVVELPLGYLLARVSDWAAFCNEVGLNPWLLNEGLATADDTHAVSISVLKKYGVL